MKAACNMTLLEILTFAKITHDGEVEQWAKELNVMAEAMIIRHTSQIVVFHAPEMPVLSTHPREKIPAPNFAFPE